MTAARAEIASLMYHEVTDDPSTTGFQRASARPYATSTRVFLEHLDRIQRSGMTPEKITDIDPAKGGQHLMLTFDDGGKSALHAGEELARRGWRGHFFAVTSRLGERTFLDAVGLRALRDMGHLVGTHSHTHPDIFRDLTADKIREEWRTSAGIVEDLLGEPCLAASVPGGDISAAALAATADAGFRYVFTSEPWTTPRRLDDTWFVGRLCLKAGTTGDAVEALVHFRGWRLARLERGLKELARYGMAPLYRFYVERSTAPQTPGIGARRGA